MHVSVFRHVKFKAWMLTSFLENFFDAKRLILWTVNILHVLTFDTTLNLDTNDEHPSYTTHGGLGSGEGVAVLVG